jgi:hypothetical protein
MIFGQLQFVAYEHSFDVISSTGGKILFIENTMNIVLLKFKDNFFNI